VWSVDHVRWLLAFANGLALVVGTMAWCAAAWWPLGRAPTVMALADPQTDSVPTITGSQRLPLTAWEPYWNIPLRRPLQDPEVKPTAVAIHKAVPRPRLNMRLVGTIVEAGQATALLQVGASDVQLRKIGEIVEGVADCRVVEVSAELVRLRHFDQDVVLELRPEHLLP
jgi:hypothetical protein